MTYDENDFIAAYDERTYDRPSLTVDLALLSVIDGQLKVLLMRRAEHPGKGKWALPGGFVGMREDLETAANRVLKDKARLADIYLEQLYTFGSVERDPRTRVVTVVYFALLPAARFERALWSHENLVLADLSTRWSGETGGPAEARSADGAAMPLAFDHAEILGVAVKRLRGKLDYSAIGFELLPRQFTLRQLQEIHEAIRGETLNKPAFRRRLLDTGRLKATGRYEQGKQFRPAELYEFVRKQPAKTSR